MTTQPDQHELPECLETNYTIESHGVEWHLFCKHCWRTFIIKKGPFPDANLKYLMGHARLHSYSMA